MAFSPKSRFRILCCTVILSCTSLWNTGVSQAQFGMPEVQATPVKYSRNLPRSLARAMPRGAKSVFWAKVAIDKQRSPLLIHLFTRKKMKQTPERKNIAAPYLTIDIFQQDKRSLRKLHHFEQETWDGDGEPLRSRMHIVWLEQKEKRVLILVNDYFSYNEYGEDGDSYFSIIQLDKSMAIKTQRFGYGGSNNGSTNYHLSRNEQGILQIESVYQESGGNTTQEYRWNNEKAEFEYGASDFRSNY